MPNTVICSNPRPIALFIAWFLALYSTVAAAQAYQQCQQPDVSGRRSIGLALGGGGARGYAHLGVIKKLEELRVPYDYIAGTSMGAIVGGFLATGMDSEALTEVVRQAKWDDLFEDNTEREVLPFRRKTDDELGLFGPKLGIGKGNNLLPKGVRSGQKITFMFESVSSLRVTTSDFDLLPIPFRAIATDIVTGDMVVLGSGELSMAMRASMSVPGVFDPVDRNGAMLVDGGLVRNLPVDVTRDMGADVVIAVDVGTKLAGKEEMNSALAIIYQMSGLLTVSNTDVQIKSLQQHDVLISPQIGDLVSSADFNKLEVAIPLGYAAAEAVEEQLREYALSESEYRLWREHVESCVKGPPSVYFVSLDNQSRFSDKVLRELITIQPGQPLDLEQLDHDLRQIYGLGFIRQARYSIVEQDGKQGIEITVLQDERGPSFIETGLDLDFGDRGTDFNLRAAYLKTDLDERGSEFRAMVQAGESPGLLVEYFKPLDDKLRYSFRPSASFFRRPLYVYDDLGDAIAELKVQQTGAGIALTREFGRYARATIGYSRYSGDLDIVVGNPDIKPFPFDSGEVFTELQLDRLDNRYLPTRGVYSSLRYTISDEKLGADLDFNQLELSLFGSHTFGRHNVLFGALYDTSLDDNIPIYAYFTGGGFMKMSGYEPGSLLGSHFGMVAAGYRYQVVQSGLLPGFVGATLEYGNAAENRKDIFADGKINGSVYFAYQSPLGPVYLGVGWSEERSALIFLRLGSIFSSRSVARH